MTRVQRSLLLALSILAASVGRPNEAQAYPNTLEGCTQAAVDGLGNCVYWGHPENLCVDSFWITIGLCRQQYDQ